MHYYRCEWLVEIEKVLLIKDLITAATSHNCEILFGHFETLKGYHGCRFFVRADNIENMLQFGKEANAILGFEDWVIITEEEFQAISTFRGVPLPTLNQVISGQHSLASFSDILEILYPQALYNQQIKT